ncbi:MAG: VOC family protein [Granulosicoccus sp.]
MADQDNVGKVTGIGGVFFLANKESKNLSSWYEEHLGITLESWGGGVLEWKNDKAEDGGATVWNVAAADSEWFAPSKARFMINYRVDNMEALIAKLTAAGIQILEGPQFEENGVFAWIVDPDGNKIELWEPMIWDDKNKR